MTADLCVVPLATGRHDRDAFTCGIESLDRYLKEQASQDLKRKANAVFVLVAAERPAEIIGYFTLCASALTQGDVPAEARKHVPRYPLVSVTLLGRLAIARAHRRRGLGPLLLVEALRRAYDNTALVGSCMVVVDAIDERAAKFYADHGFIRLPESMRLVLPMQTLAMLFPAEGKTKASPPQPSSESQAPAAQAPDHAKTRGSPSSPARRR